MSLTTFLTPVLDGYKRLKPGTMLHVDESMKQRAESFKIIRCMDENARNKKLSDEGIQDIDSRYAHYTTSLLNADGAVYFLEDGNPMLAITREAHNPILNPNPIDLPVPFSQKKEYVIISPKNLASILAAEDTEVFEYAKLPVRDLPVSMMYGDNDDSVCAVAVPSFCTFVHPSVVFVDAYKDYKRLFERVYGKGDNLFNTFQILTACYRNLNVITSIYLPHLDYLKKNLKNSQALAALTLSKGMGYGGESLDFLANGISLQNDSIYRMRGELL